MASANVKQRPDGKYRARYRDESGREHSRHFTRKRDADQWLAEQVAALSSGTWVDPTEGRVTFARYYADFAAMQPWESTTRRAMDLAAGSVPFGDLALSAIRPAHLQRWVKDMQRRGLAASTIRTRVNNVRSVFRQAVRDRLIARNPADDLALPRERRKEAAMSVPTTEDVGAILRAAGEPWAVFFALAAFAGLREGEACGLQVGDVDFLRRRLHVRRQVQRVNGGTVEVRGPKYGSERTVHLPDRLVAMLSEHVRGLDPDGWLFTSARGPAHANTVGHQWRKACRAAGVNVKLHDLRHYYASGLIAAGCDVVTVQHALGHAKATTTLATYSHLWGTAEDRTRQAAASLMDDALDFADQVRTSEA
jgi:integrase